MHVIAAKAVALGEALQPGLQALPGAGARERARAGRGAAEARPAHRLRAAPTATCSWSTCAPRRSPARTPRPRSGARTSRSTRTRSRTTRRSRSSPRGIRIGTPAMTTRGFGEVEAEELAQPDRRRAGRAGRRADARSAWRARSRRCARKFPVYELRRMKCPFCGRDDTQVIDSRVRTRRRTRSAAGASASSCDKRFTTYERVELRMPQVVKTDGSRTDFDRDKLRRQHDARAAQAPGADRGRRRGGRPHRASRCARWASARCRPRRVGEMVMRELAQARQGRLHPLRLGLSQLRDAGRLPRAVQEVEGAEQTRRK